ncbi:hypothetical protein [Candidatus Protochlamydia naegleriophila]|nr:hypothetical protein [Candidatus Protochlamydia naegleriophila]
MAEAKAESPLCLAKDVVMLEFIYDKQPNCVNKPGGELSALTA